MKTFLVIIGILLILGMAYIILVGMKAPEDLSSVPIANDYHSTSTGVSNWDMISTLQTGNGALGSVIITTAGSGRLTLYDATTSNAYLRPISANASTTTSSLATLAQFSTTASALGTYTFDVFFKDGLLMVWEGTKDLLGSTTITFR